MIGESSFLPPGRVFFEQVGYPGYQLFEHQHLLQNGMPMPVKPLVDQNGNNQAYLRPIANEVVNEGIYGYFFWPQKYPLENSNFMYQPPQFPTCYQELPAFPTKAMCSWPRDSHEMIPNEGHVTCPVNAFAPVQGTQTWWFAEPTNETQRNHEISRCFLAPYSGNLGNVWPQLGSCYSEQDQLIMKKNYSFNNPVSSKVVSRALYPEQANAPLPSMFPRWDQFSVRDPYLPAYEGIENGWVVKGSSDRGPFCAPPFGGMAVPYCYTTGKPQHVTNMKGTAFCSENSSRVGEGQPQEQEVEPVAVKFYEPEIKSIVQNASVAWSVCRSDVTCPNAFKEVQILKVATISPRPGSNHPKKPKDKFAVILEKNEQHTREESEIAKPLDLGNQEQQYDLANAPIFQMLCETTTV